MFEAVTERTKGHTIFLFLPKPIDNEAPPSEITSHNNPTYEYDENIHSDASKPLSHKEQIDHLCAGFSAERKDLEQNFPIGNHILFLTKRIYAKSGLFWVLTSLHLDVWAAVVPQKCAMLEEPPMSNMFTKAQSMKPPHPGPDASPEVFATYDCHLKGHDYVRPAVPQNPEPVMPPFPPTAAMGPYQAPQGYPSLYPHGHGPPPPMHHMPYYPPYLYPYYIPPPLPPAGPASMIPPPLQPAPQNEMPSPSATTSHTISLKKFCSVYKISASDQEKLTRLGYMPGNRVVESLLDADWQQVSFSVLG
ncbi:hypothetical protein BDN67DRAFT_1015551 [Paxillus ammoniavirescens]|nr:hypothetical protein BDN67DRAFT_1015551 [Paxillus ammoniavirescens]